MSALCVLLFLSPAALWMEAGANLDVTVLETGEISLLSGDFSDSWDETAGTDEIRQHMRQRRRRR